MSIKKCGERIAGKRYDGDRPGFVFSCPTCGHMTKEQERLSHDSYYGEGQFAMPCPDEAVFVLPASPPNYPVDRYFCAKHHAMHITCNCKPI